MVDVREGLFGQTTLSLYRGGRVVVAHGATERLPEWMREGALSSIDQLCRDFSGPLQIAQGRTYPEDAAGTMNFVGAGGQTAVSGVNAAALLRLGLSVYFGELDRTVPKASSFLRSIEGALSLRRSMRLSAFANAPGSGLPLHHDSYDQLLVHLIGEKIVSYRESRDVSAPRLSYSPSGPVPRHFESVYRHGFSDRTTLKEEDLTTVVLKPGSCLFLPAGTWHRTEDQKEPCLSLTTAMRAPSRLELLTETLRAYLGQAEEWRAPVYGALLGESDAEEVQATEALVRDLSQRLKEVAFADLRQVYAAGDIEPGRVETYPEDEHFEHFVRLPSSVCEMATDPQDAEMIRCKVRVFTRPVAAELRMDAGARSVIEWILEQRRVFSVAEVARVHDEFEEEDLARIVMQLAQVGLLRPVPKLTWSSEISVG